MINVITKELPYRVLPQEQLFYHVAWQCVEVVSWMILASFDQV